ncbi:protein scarlet-like [Eriocheir sinensis]|uniref:protein scarlet-like n=1 Tax=Eriocheir sinensis TaxID=95602 RepID=UPI0021C85108|nr:protein scarlet-like [Eriocheir sinensis]XP_050697926.1 protein scarlet-like [Eriocheir sinensis]
MSLQKEEEKNKNAKIPLSSIQNDDYKTSLDTNGCLYKPVHREDRPLLNGKRHGYGTYGSRAAQGGVRLSWRDLSVHVREEVKRFRRGRDDQRSPAKELLHNVSGIVSPGSLTAIMGQSGAGKSTLMNALAHRTARGMVVSGEVRVNGHYLTRSITLLSGYLKQHNFFIGTLTVTEHLTFMARLRMDRHCSARQREARVQELLTELGLLEVRNTRIGAPGTAKTLSGGERRRLAFAAEIINDPQLLFCDEPTTGLDSYNAEVIVKILQDMAARGKTVLCTIHQPSSEIFTMFNRLLLLAEGRLAFMGSSVRALHFWESLGHKCPSTFNPADHFISTLAVLPGHEIRSRESIRQICDNFAASAYFKDIDITIRHYDILEGSTSYEEEHLFENIPEKPGWMVEWWWLSRRSLLDARRHARFRTTFTQKIVFSLLGALCFSNLSLNQAGIQNIQGLLYFIIAEACHPVFFSSVDMVRGHLPLFFQEYEDGLYGCDTYYFSLMVTLLPRLLVETVVYCVLTYWLTGLQPYAYPFLLMFLITLSASLTSSSCAVLISVMFEKFDSIIMATGAIHLFNVVCSGLFINLDTVSWLTGGLKYLTWVMYGQEMLTVSQWSDVKNITCEFPEGVPCITTGEEVIEKYAYQTSDLYPDFAWLFLVYCFYHTLGFITLYSRARRK